MTDRQLRHLPLALVLVLLPEAVFADAFCQRCFETYRAPGGADSGSIGLYRLDGCPLCQKVDCKDAKKHAEEMLKKYKDLRWSYEQFKKRLDEMRANGQTISRTNQQQLDDMKAQLGCLEAHYAMLEKKCPKEVPGTNIWDGSYDGPVGESPTSEATEAARDARIAKDAANSYERMSEQEKAEFDTVNGFLGAKLGEYQPPDRGYNGGRYESTKTSRDVSDAYRKQAQELTSEPGKPRPNVNLRKPVVPQFRETKLNRGEHAHVHNNGVAVRARSEGNQYILAYLKSRDLHRQAVAVGDRDAVKLHAHNAVVCASQAKGYADWAAKHQHKSDVEHQKLLDESLTAAAKKGLTLSALLEKFQAEVKASGLPPHIERALREAGATDAERADTKSRLLGMTPASVEAFLKDRRARIARGVEVPDMAILDLQLATAREAHVPVERR